MYPERDPRDAVIPPSWLYPDLTTLPLIHQSVTKLANGPLGDPDQYQHKELQQEEQQQLSRTHQQ